MKESTNDIIFVEEACGRERLSSEELEQAIRGLECDVDKFTTVSHQSFHIEQLWRFCVKSNIIYGSISHRTLPTSLHFLLSSPLLFDIDVKFLCRCPFDQLFLPSLR